MNKADLEDVVERQESVLTDLQYEVEDLLPAIREAHDVEHDADGHMPWSICPSEVCKGYAELEAMRDRIAEVVKQ